jgi:hypothetical protein
MKNAPPTRSEKASALLTQVMPTAVSTGLQGFTEMNAARSAAGAIGGAAGGATGTAAGTAGSLTRLLGTGGTALGIVGGVFGAYNLASSFGRSTPAAGASSGIAVGAALGTVIGGPGFGTAIGAALGAIGGGLIGAITNGKHKDQKVRDEVRKLLVENGVLDQNFRLTLADGSQYDMGKDGGPRAELGGRRPFEIDFNNPLAKYAISWLNPLVHLTFGSNQKVQSDLMGYFTNAVLSNAKSLDDVRSNVNAILGKFGVSDQTLADSITYAEKSGALNKGLAAAYLNGVRERTDVNFELPLAANGSQETLAA